MNPRCKIGKIKLRGGAELVLINTVRPQKEILEILRDELSKAEAGETTSLAVASVTRNGWTDNRFFVSDGDHDHLLAGACERVKHRIIKGEE